MKFSFKGKKVAKSIVAVGCAGAMMMAFAPSAFASTDAKDLVGTDAMSADGYVTCAAARAAMPTPEMLGLTGIEDNASTFSSVTSWDSPKYLLMGSNLNSNPNAYFYNTLLVSTGNNSSATPTVLVNPSRSGDGRGPGQGLGKYGADETDDAVWNAMPDVVLGGGGVDYDTAEYAGAVSSDYHPKSVAYNFSVFSNLIDSMYETAAAGDAVVKESNGAKKLRYGSATAIAQNYEKYIKGTRGYIQKRLKDDGKSVKTIAVVSAVNEDGTVTLVKTGVEEGTASTNRLIEATQTVATNLGDTTQTVTKEELVKKADLILIGGQTGAGEALADTEAIKASLGADALAKCYYVNGGGSAGSMYGVVMNSCENAQNIGRILGCLYPEYVDQDDWISYYYDNFYHIKSGSLGTAIDNAMDGVVNWDATGSDRTQWTAKDAKTYNKKNVQRKIDTGIQYIQSQGESASALNKLTSNISKTSVSKIAQTVKVSPSKKTVKSKKKTTVNIKATAEGKISYKVTKKASNKISVTKAGKVTIKKGAKAGKYVVAVKAAASGEYKAGSSKVTITVK